MALLSWKLMYPLEETGDALEGSVSDGTSVGIYEIGERGGSESDSLVPPVWDQSEDGLQVVGPACGGRSGELAGAVASSVELAAPEGGADGIAADGDASGVSGVGSASCGRF